MAKTLSVTIVSPDGSVFQGEAAGVRAPGVEGSFEVLYDHAPMIAAFNVGPLFIREADGDRIVFATSGGFLEVVDNTVTVLAETAEPASEIDVERAQEAERQAVEALKHASPEERAKIEAALNRARNRARVAMGQVGTTRGA